MSFQQTCNFKSLHTSVAETDQAGLRSPNFPNYHTAVTHDELPTDDTPTTQKALINKTTHTQSALSMGLCAEIELSVAFVVCQ